VAHDLSYTIVVLAQSHFPSTSPHSNSLAKDNLDLTSNLLSAGNLPPDLCYSITAVDFSGPLLVQVSAKLGSRPAMMVGVLIFVCGLLGTAYAPNLYVIYVTYGVCIGKCTVLA